MPAWIHNRAEHILAKNPSMNKSQAFAIATQQSHKMGKTPKGYGTAEGKREAKAKYDKPRREYTRSANPGGLETPKLSDKPKTEWTGNHLVKKGMGPVQYSVEEKAFRREIAPGVYAVQGLPKLPGGEGEGKGPPKTKKAPTEHPGVTIGKSIASKMDASNPDRPRYASLKDFILRRPVGKSKESCMSSSKTASAMRNELISITMHKLGKEYIQGGKADGKTDADFPEDQLDMGQKVEMEHTNDPAMAREISRDHLEEFKDYYTRLAKMEDEAKKAKGEKTAEKDEDEGPGRGTNEKDVKAIREYMKARKPGSEDSNFHRFSEGRGLNVHEAEEAAYDMLGSAMNPTAS